MASNCDCEELDRLKNDVNEIYNKLQDAPELDSETLDALAGRARAFLLTAIEIKEKLDGVFKMLTDQLDAVVEMLDARMGANKSMTSASDDHTLIDDVKQETDDMSNKKQMTALVVDDNKLACSIYSDILTKLGVITRVVENGKEAVELCRLGGKFDLILMDFEMPMMNGAEATRALRMMGVTSKIVGITARSRDSEITEFREAGIDKVQEKPLTRPMIESILMEINNSR